MAKRYKLTVQELEKLNVHRTFTSSFTTLGAGVEIDVPRAVSPFSVDNKEHATPSTLETAFASYAHTTATALVNDNAVKAGEQMLRSAATQQANTAVQQWLNHYGRARVQLNVDQTMTLKNSEADLLLPLYENHDYLVFTQLGARNKDSRNTTNIGAGVRTLLDNWLLGLNTFYDYDITGKNKRLGFGAEAWRDYMKLSVNSYVGLTTWHQSPDVANYNERPANGFDIRAEAWLPSYPQLGGKVMYEQYRGNSVALFGQHHRQKNPYAYTLGVNYTPFPLLTFSTEQRRGKSSQNDTRFNLQMNYQLGVAWHNQINPSAVAASQQLQGNRYDLVDRNYHIVLDYQRQSLIHLSLPERIEGYGTYILSLTAQVTTKYPLERIEWNSPALLAAGGQINSSATNGVEIRLPQNNVSSAANNTYALTAVAYDREGNASNQATTHIRVQAPEVSNQHSERRAVPARLVANGTAQSIITFILKDQNNVPIPGLVDVLSVSKTEETEGDASLMRGSQDSQLSKLAEVAPGEYNTTLTAGTQPTSINVAVTLRGQPLNSVVIPLVAGSLDVGRSRFTAVPNEITAGSGDTSRLTFTARDANNNPVRGLTVAFVVTGVGDTILSNVSETKNTGVYTATLKGSTAGTATVTPQAGSTVLQNMAQQVTLSAGPFVDSKSTFTAAPATITVGSGDTSRLTFTARDANNNPVRGLTVAFVVTGVGDTILSNVSETKNTGVYTATLKGSTAGTATVTPQAGSTVLQNMAQQVTLSAGPLVDSKSTFTAAPTTITAGSGDTSRLTFTARDANNNPVRGLTVAFVVTGVDNTTLSKVTETKNTGIYTATLKGSTAGTATIKPYSNDVQVGTLSTTVTLTDPVTLSIEKKSTLNAIADNAEIHTVRISARSGGKVRGNVPLQLTAINGVTFSTNTPTTNASGYVDVTLRKSGSGGTVKVQASLKDNDAIKAEIDLNFLTLRSIHSFNAQNGGNFSGSSRFPTTGFATAPYTINATGSTTDNNKYSWTSSDTALATVDANGNVELISFGRRTAITITARGATDAFRHTFTINTWFDYLSTANSKWSDANAYCQNRSARLPSRAELTNGEKIRTVGSLWGEWAWRAHYNRAGAFWTNESNLVEKYIVYAKNGAIGSVSPTTGYVIYAVCVMD